MITPTQGRIVLYCLGANDVAVIQDKRRIRGDHGNPVNEGDVFPGVVVRVWSGDCINIKVMLDGPDEFWATSRSVSEEPMPYRFHWMPYQKQVAAQS